MRPAIVITLALLALSLLGAAALQLFVFTR